MQNMRLSKFTYFSQGTWHTPGEPYNPKKVHEDVVYTEEDDKAIDDWVSGRHNTKDTRKHV